MLCTPGRKIALNMLMEYDRQNVCGCRCWATSTRWRTVLFLLLFSMFGIFHNKTFKLRQVSTNLRNSMKLKNNHNKLFAHSVRTIVLILTARFLHRRKLSVLQVNKPRPARVRTPLHSDRSSISTRGRSRVTGGGNAFLHCSFQLHISQSTNIHIQDCSQIQASKGQCWRSLEACQAQPRKVLLHVYK